MPLRVLLFTSETHPTYRADVAVLFGKCLPALGIESDLVAGRNCGDTADVGWGGGKAYVCNVSGGEAKQHLLTLPLSIRHLLGANQARYGAIQVRDRPILALLALVIARLKGLPFVYWMSYPLPEGQVALARERGLHAGMLKYVVPWLLGRGRGFVLYRFVLPHADHIFVQSERMRTDVSARGIALDRMTAVPMGVDLAAIRSQKVDPVDDKRLKGRRVLVYLGTLDPPRRIEVLFEMLALVIEAEPRAQLVLVGDTNDDDHRVWLQQRAAKAGVAEHVVWTGWLPMRESWRYVRAAEIGLSPFPRGPLLDSASPTKVCEYLALGLPIVCNDNPDQAEVVGLSGAGRCVHYTAGAFASAVLELLACDANHRRVMSESGVRFVQQYRDYPLIAKRVADCYRRVVLTHRAAT